MISKNEFDKIHSKQKGTPKNKKENNEFNMNIAILSQDGIEDRPNFGLNDINLINLGAVNRTPTNDENYIN